MDMPDFGHPIAGQVRGGGERHGGEAAPEGDGADLPETRIPGRGKGRRGNCAIP